MVDVNNFSIKKMAPKVEKIKMYFLVALIFSTFLFTKTAKATSAEFIDFENYTLGTIHNQKGWQVITGNAQIENCMTGKCLHLYKNTHIKKTYPEYTHVDFSFDYMNTSDIYGANSVSFATSSHSYFYLQANTNDYYQEPISAHRYMQGQQYSFRLRASLLEGLFYFSDNQGYSFTQIQEDSFYYKIEPTSASTEISLTTNDAANQLQNNDYYDNINIGFTFLEPQNSVYFVYPQNDYQVDNNEFADWSFNYELPSLSSEFNYLKAKIYYQDSQGKLYIEEEEIPITTELTNYNIERSNDLPEGVTLAWVDIQASENDSQTCTLTDCTFYLVASSPEIIFDMVYLGKNIFDYGVTGFTPSTTTLSTYYDQNQVEEYSFIGTVLNNAYKSISVIFPFNLAVKIYEQWKLADTISFPASMNFLTTLYSEEGKIYLDLPTDFFGSLPNDNKITVLGEETFSDITASRPTLMSEIKVFSAPLMYIMFTLGMILRGYTLLKEYQE